MIAKKIYYWYYSYLLGCGCCSDAESKCGVEFDDGRYEEFDLPVCYEQEDLVAYLGDLKIFLAPDTKFECQYF